MIRFLPTRSVSHVGNILYKFGQVWCRLKDYIGEKKYIFDWQKVISIGLINTKTLKIEGWFANLTEKNMIFSTVLYRNNCNAGCKLF